MQHHSVTSLETHWLMALIGGGGEGEVCILRSPGIVASPISLLSIGRVCGRRSLTAGKILFTGRQTCSPYLVLWLCGLKRLTLRVRRKPLVHCIPMRLFCLERSPRLTQRVRCAPQINSQLFLNIDAGAIGYLRCEGVLLLTLRIKILYNSKFMQFQLFCFIEILCNGRICTIILHLFIVIFKRKMFISVNISVCLYFFPICFLQQSSKFRLLLTMK